MPPKKPTNETPQPADEFEDMSKEEIEELRNHLREELDQERQECNYARLERDKIHTFWENTKQGIEEKNACLHKKDLEMAEVEEKHQNEIRIHKQRMKNILYEQQLQLADLQRKEEATTKQMKEQQEHRENQLRRTIHNLKMQMRSQELDNAEKIRTLKLAQEQELTKIGEELEKELQEFETNCEMRRKKQREEQILRHKTEIHALEQRKNIHINMLIKNHEKDFNDLKTYYKGIVHENRIKIIALEDQLAILKKREKEEMLKEKIVGVMKENSALTESLQKARQGVSQLLKKYTRFRQDEVFLEGLKARNKYADKDLRKKKSAIRMLEERLHKAQQEKDELDSRLQKTGLEVQQKYGSKILELREKLNNALNILDTEEMFISDTE